MTTAVHGPTSTSIVARGRPSESLLLGTVKVCALLSVIIVSVIIGLALAVCRCTPLEL